LEKPPAEVKEIRAIIRNPSIIPSGFFPSDDRLKILAGDVTDEKSLNEVLQGAQYAIFAAAGGRSNNVEVDEFGLKKTLIAANTNGVKRVAICSSQLVDPVNRWVFVRIMLNTVVWGIMDSKFRGENHVRDFCRGPTAKTEYTIVRPGRLIDGPLGGSGGLRLGQTNGHFMRGGSSTRADIARLLVQSLASPAARNCTVEVGGGAGTPDAGAAADADVFAGMLSDEARAAVAQ
jgi:hypothetical protein